MKQYRQNVLKLMFAALLVVANSAISLAQNEKALLWEISGNGLRQASYLFGTYRLLTDSYLKELPEINEPLKKSKGIVVEIVMDSAKLPMLSSMALMPDKKISELINSTDFKLVSDELEKLVGVNLTAMNQLKPMAVMTVMTLIYSQKLNAETISKYPGLPMDYFLAATGKSQNKDVTALETLEEQINLLYNYLPLEEQAKQLVAYAREKEMVAKSQVDLNALYLEKDLAKMHSMMEMMPEELGVGDFMLKDRNTKWMKVLPGLIKKQSQFIAVGALHLTGPDGLITLFRKLGYTVKPVN